MTKWVFGKLELDQMAIYHFEITHRKMEYIEYRYTVLDRIEYIF